MSTAKIDVVGSKVDQGDLQERADGFSKELDVICGKYELSINAIPKITLDGRMDAVPVFVSSRKPEENKEEKKVEEDVKLSE